MKTYRVAVVGCGAISKNHVHGILAAGQKLAALCDVDRERAERLLTLPELSGTKIYTDFSGMLDSEPLDAVHICTPHYLHAPMVVEALRHGLNVLCEKPLCVSAEQLEEILKAEKESGATLGVCLQNRYEPMMKRARELAGNGENVAAAFGNVVWERDADYYRSGDWRGKLSTEGGGVMINQALHTLDLLGWFCGMPSAVTARVSNDHLGGVIEVEDTAYARFTYPDGKTLHFFATTAADANLPVQVVLKMKDGTTVTAQNGWLMKEGETTVVAERETAPGKREWGIGHRELIADFYRCLSEGKPFPIDGAEGGKVVRMILAMYASNGKEISIH